MPNEDADDSGEQDDEEAMDDPPMSRWTNTVSTTSSSLHATSCIEVPVPQQPQFSNPDETIEQVMQPAADEESSSEDPQITEPDRIQIKQRHVSCITWFR